MHCSFQRRLAQFLVLLLCAVAPMAYPVASRPAGIVVLLNGTGSAGKSSIGRVLENTLDNAVFLNEEQLVFNAYRHLLERHHLNSPRPLHGIADLVRYRQTLPAATEATLKREFQREGEEWIQRDTHRLLVQSMQQGHPFVIVDNSLWKPELVERWRQETQGYQSFHVVVYCSLAKVLEHIQERNLSPQTYEHRTVDLPLEMYFSMYPPAQVGPPIDRLFRDHVELDLRNTFAYKRKICGQPTSEKVIQKYLHQSHLDVRDQVDIAPFFEHDMVVNTGTATPQQCAEQIRARLLGSRVIPTHH